MINIVNILVGRKCNLKCNYCRISGNIDYDKKPYDYPDSTYYFNNERTSDFWIAVCDSLHLDNPNTFFIIYGGEPLLYPGLSDIIKHLNFIGANYTIISNSTPELDKLRDKFFSEVGTVKGWTASIDPGFETIIDSDESRKSNYGYHLLKKLISEGLVEDPVAEITCDRDSIFKVEETIKKLSAEGIWSDLTVLDWAPTNRYDFSNVDTKDMLVPKTEEVKNIFDRLINSDYKIHMKNSLLPKIYDMLPAELDCGIGKDNLHSICIDSDGSMRLCLRIKGHFTTKFNANNLFDVDIREKLEEAIETDKEIICKHCSHTCYIMSQLDYEDIVDH